MIRLQIFITKSILTNNAKLKRQSTEQQMNMWLVRIDAKDGRKLSNGIE